MRTATIQLRQRGVLTLPRSLREKYRLEEGDPLTLVDLDGVLLLSPKQSILPKLTAEIERLRREAGVSMGELLAGLPRQRKPAGRRRAAR
jgi:bifunctional DNA-binding transcriptional regulator/antitoxin component of YhaV-PrlF toxin-antitoxin module